MKLLTGPQRTNWRVWILGAVAAVILYAFWPNSAPDDSAVVTAAPGNRDARSRVARESTAPLGFARRMVSQVSTNLFTSHSWYVAPPPPPRQPSQAPAVPTAPSLPFTFLGSYARAGDKPVFFLVKNDRVYDVHVGDVLENLYSVDGAEGGQLQMTYLPLGTKQALQVGGSP